MEAAQLDAVEFRAGQRRDWGSAAKGWHDWQELILGSTAGVSRRLVELAGIESGDRVLDVAAGSGEPSLTAAKLVGAAGQVVATDISSEMLGYARERAALVASRTSSSSRARLPHSTFGRPRSMR